MTVARVYIMHARTGQGSALQSALEALIASVRQLKGNEGVEFLRDRGNSERFIFIEKWATEEDHHAALAGPKPAGLDAVLAASDGPPKGAYFDYVRIA